MARCARVAVGHNGATAAAAAAAAAAAPESPRPGHVYHGPLSVTGVQVACRDACVWMARPRCVPRVFVLGKLNEIHYRGHESG